MRYEDFTLSMVNQAKKLFDFMGLDFLPISKNFLFKATHPNTSEELPHNVHIRDPNLVVKKWWKHLPMSQVNQIQKKCVKAMQLWGYTPVKNYNKETQLFEKDFKIT